MDERPQRGEPTPTEYSLADKKIKRKKDKKIKR